MTEQDLISRILTGDKSGREVFFDKYNKLVWHVINRSVERPQDAEDLFQEVFVHLFKDDCAPLRKWRGDNLPAFLARIVRNLAIDQLRAQRTRQQNTISWPEINNEASEDHGSQADLPDPQASPEARMLVAETLDSLRKGIAQLLPRDRDLLIRYYISEQTYSEIAEQTGMSINNVGVALNRARERLATILRQKYSGIFH